jgi:hypothetical protein
MMLLVPWCCQNTCLRHRGRTTIFLRLGNFQPALLGNFQSAQTGDFSTGTDSARQQAVLAIRREFRDRN